MGIANRDRLVSPKRVVRTFIFVRLRREVMSTLWPNHRASEPPPRWAVGRFR
jgi:hypothetical protein